jgi:hypothetical protein
LSAGSGPEVARLFHRALALVFLGAWLSLGIQVHLLIGSRGLMPLAEFIDVARTQPSVSFFDLPTLFWWTQSDGVLTAGVVVGVALSLVALSGYRPRLCFALSTALYLSYVTACRLFLAFQWDNLLLECGLLASFLPAGRGAPLVHLLLRILLFKLYFESGIAKWQSPLHDWHDGSAMTFYYETAPLPTWLAWTAHNLPGWWHRFESRATLVLELGIPFAIFGSRRLRLGAAAIFTAFQIANLATANYGFFCYLTIALHIMLLDDEDVRRMSQFLRRKATAPAPAQASHEAGRWRGRLALTGASVYLLISFIQALFHFSQPGAVLARLSPVMEWTHAFRLVSTYHLFAAITRERIEPEIQTRSGDEQQGVWTAQHLHHKPGDPGRAPNLVAPHQPRVDFQLWFHGLSFQRRQPAYVATLLGRLCEDPSAVQPLFRSPLPPQPDAVRMTYWQYHFTTRAERRATGAWWRRTLLTAHPAVACHR